MAANSSLPRPVPVKNKAPNPIQLSFEQVLRDARNRFAPFDLRPLPKQKITDSSELDDYRLRKRKEFEDVIRRPGKDLGVWKKYARWEESQKDFTRARSVWELVIDANYRDHSLWVAYAEFEMKNKFINHARNVWDRAVTLLPRVDQLWYKYIHLEQTLGNVAGARQLYDRWMNCIPDEKMWLSYINFELRYNETNRARQIYERFVQCHPTVTAWLRYAKFEMRNRSIDRARSVYERALEKLCDDDDDDDDEESHKLLIAFAEFDERCKETERARFVYEFALKYVPKGGRAEEELFKRFTAFEKRCGGGEEEIGRVITAKRRTEYEDGVRRNPMNYGAWFDYIRLEESIEGNVDRLREVYERAIANVPPADEKRYWRRYIYLWIKYALYEELEARDMERTRKVYRECLKLIPHKRFSFRKIWLLAADFELRQMNLNGARKILGNAIGMAPKGKVFVKYIEMEMTLGNMNRCRKLHEKYLEWSPDSAFAWKKYAEFEEHLCQTERARAIYDLGIGQEVLDAPEDLWVAYLEFEISQGEHERARALYERLLERTQHLRVWTSYATFEASLISDDDDDDDDEEEEEDCCIEQKKQCIMKVRRVFERALDCFRTTGAAMKAERAKLLENWLEMEKSLEPEFGDVNLVRALWPRKVKRMRPVSRISADGAVYEEYTDYIFPEEIQSHTGSLKIQEAAHKWKKQKIAFESDD